MKHLKAIAYWTFYNLILAANKEVPTWERVVYFFKGIISFILSSFIFAAVSNWWADEKLFTAGLTFIVFANAALGGWLHWKRHGDFDWGTLLKKTVEMIVVVWLIYIVFEIIISRARPEILVIGFRSVLQIATLAYPGIKVAKNTYILTGGKHPPKWMMTKLYNFEKNGDLKAFLETNNQNNETNS